VDRREEYRRLYKEAVKSGNRINPIVIKNHEVFDGEKLYSRWSKYKKYLRKGMPLSTRMLDLFTRHTSLGIRHFIYDTKKVDGWSYKHPIIFDTVISKKLTITRLERP